MTRSDPPGGAEWLRRLAHAIRLRRAPRVAVEKAQPDDAPLLADVGLRMFPASHGAAFADDRDLAHFTLNVFGPQAMRQLIANVRARVLVARHQHRVAGFLKLGTGEPAPKCVPGKAPAELARFYLDDGYIGRGVGARLLETAMQQAARDGHDTCWLMVWEKNARAMRFYERWRFEAVGEHVIEVGASRLPLVVMSRPLGDLA